ncbi:MAG TPA: radical SAM protein [Stellaceae bacterium]|jgi:radical SAM superfamily enzyme YgiQ (UPF0313 family)
MADIVIINPRFQTSYWGLEHAVPFLGIKAVLPVASLPLLAALTPPEHRVTLIDENVEPIDFEQCARADIVGVTGMNVQRSRMREILAELRRRGCFTVAGGAWVTVREDDVADHADVIFIGEAEETWPRFLAEWGEGRHATRYEQAERTDMATVPRPRLDLLRMNDYALASLQFSRGCPFECEFCDIIVTFGRRPRIKTSAQILAELDGILATGKRTAFIVDDNLIGNKKAIKPLLRDVITWQQAHGYSLMFATEASIDLAEDPELMRLMVDANISEVFIGIETPNEAALRETKKIQNLRARGGTMLEKVHRIQETGMEVWCGVIVGFDHDDASIFAAQHRFITEARIANAMVNMLVAIPRTPLYRRLDGEGRLDHSGDPAGFGPFGTNVIPQRIGRDELREGYVALMRDLYAPAAFFGRLDTLYLGAWMRWGGARHDYLSRHPLRRARLNARLLAETLGIFIMLMRGVPDPALRREYRRRLFRIVLRRPAPAILQLYAVKCAMHFHVHTMVQQMLAEPRPLVRVAA